MNILDIFRELVRSLKEEMKPRTKTAQLVDPLLLSLSQEKELVAPAVETIQWSSPAVVTEEKYSPPDLELTTMEDPVLEEVRDDIILSPQRRKNIEECEVLNIHWIIPIHQHCDTTDRDWPDWSLKPPQLSIEEEDVGPSVAIVTNQADLFDQVKMLRPSFVRYRI